MIYKAHGSNASWEWLETVAPCIDILRTLATQMNQDLGSRQGSRHSSPDLSKDIVELMRSLHEHRVYCYEGGRVIEGENTEVRNVVTAGLRNLHKPLADYNNMFSRLQEQRRRTPLIGVGSRLQAQLPTQDVTSGAQGVDGVSAQVPVEMVSNNPTVLDEDSDHDSDRSSDADEDGIVWDAEDELLDRDTAHDVELYYFD